MWCEVTVQGVVIDVNSHAVVALIVSYGDEEPTRKQPRSRAVKARR